MGELRFGLVGAGGLSVDSARGRAHAQNLSLLDAGRVVAVCDHVATLAQRIAGELGAVVYTDYERFLAHGLDIVILATPDTLHAQQAVLALERGIAVLSEVPAIWDYGGCDEEGDRSRRDRPGHGRKHAGRQPGSDIAFAGARPL